ncbi:MAG: hypothetical protein WB495_23960, partial [Xanthobacteraceae bacterium]
VVGTAKFEDRIKELVEKLPDLAALVEPLLIVRRVLRQQIGVLGCLKRRPSCQMRACFDCLLRRLCAAQAMP